MSRSAADLGLRLKPAGEIRIKLLQRLGTTEEKLGAYGEAIEHLEACLVEVPAYPSLAAILRGYVLYNLAHAYYNRNGNPDNLRQAIDYYQRAAEEFRQEGMRDHLRDCLQNLAWALCDVHDAQEAAEVLDEAALLITTEQTRLHQTVVNAYQLLVAGDRTRSLDMLEPLVSRDDRSDASLFALCVTAMAALELCDTDPTMLHKAGGLTRQAMYIACSPGVDPRCWTTANRVQKRVVEALKQQNRGA